MPTRTENIGPCECCGDDCGCLCVSEIAACGGILKITLTDTWTGGAPGWYPTIEVEAVPATYAEWVSAFGNGSTYNPLCLNFVSEPFYLFETGDPPVPGGPICYAGVWCGQPPEYDGLWHVNGDGYDTITCSPLLMAFDNVYLGGGVYGPYSATVECGP